MRRVALGLVLVLALGGCGGQSELSGDAHTIFVHDWSLLSRGGYAAMVGGTLTTRDGCVLLEPDDTGYPVVWPSGTSIASEQPLTLELPSGQELAVGQTVTGGGGAIDADQVGVDIPAECVPQTGGMESGQVIVFNPDSLH